MRTVPRSRANPQYDRSVLPKSLKEFRIEYEHFPELGGLRGKSANIAESVNALWRNPSFHNYADYAIGEEFQGGLRRLLNLGRDKRCAIMCAEALWWRCHRRIIADYLIAAGETVCHILGKSHTEAATLNSAACIDRGGTLRYPA